MNSEEASCGQDCVSRRSFLAITGASSATLMLSELFPGRVRGQDAKTHVEFTEFEPKTIGKLSELQIAKPVVFHFPKAGVLTGCSLVKLGEKAGGGIGPDQDVVAFSNRCTHMGGDMDGVFDATHKVAGPCPEHLTTFDLTRHGMVVAGQATQSLPQIVLKLDGDNIIAMGIAGLLFGYSDNKTLNS